MGDWPSLTLLHFMLLWWCRWYTALTSELEVGTATNSSISPFEMRARRLVDRMAVGIQVRSIQIGMAAQRDTLFLLS